MRFRLVRLSGLTSKVLPDGIKSNDGQRPLGGHRVSIVERRDDTVVYPPGSLVEVRDKTWLITSIEVTDDGPLYAVRGSVSSSRGSRRASYGSPDDVRVLRPEDTRVVADSSPRHRSARLWLEVTLRNSPLPVAHEGLTVAPLMLADDLPCQWEAVETALDAETLRPRLTGYMPSGRSTGPPDRFSRSRGRT